MDSPVPASMFAPEPSSPEAARAAAAAARLHGGFDSDCSEDGEALNGEPELDLTSKVGPGAGGGAEETGRALKGRGGGPSRLQGDGDGAGGGGRGRAEPAHPPVREASGAPGRGAAPGGRAPPSSPGGACPASRRPAPAEITTPRLRHVERGRPTPGAPRAVAVPEQCHLPRD